MRAIEGKSIQYNYTTNYNNDQLTKLQQLGLNIGFSYQPLDTTAFPPLDSEFSQLQPLVFALDRPTRGTTNLQYRINLPTPITIHPQIIYTTKNLDSNPNGIVELTLPDALLNYKFNWTITNFLIIAEEQNLKIYKISNFDYKLSVEETLDKTATQLIQENNRNVIICYENKNELYPVHFINGKYFKLYVREEIYADQKLEVQLEKLKEVLSHKQITINADLLQLLNQCYDFRHYDLTAINAQLFQILSIDRNCNRIKLKSVATIMEDDSHAWLLNKLRLNSLPGVTPCPDNVQMSFKPERVLLIEPLIANYFKIPSTTQQFVGYYNGEYNFLNGILDIHQNSRDIAKIMAYCNKFLPDLFQKKPQTENCIPTPQGNGGLEISITNRPYNCTIRVDKSSRWQDGRLMWGTGIMVLNFANNPNIEVTYIGEITYHDDYGFIPHGKGEFRFNTFTIMVTGINKGISPPLGKELNQRLINLIYPQDLVNKSLDLRLIFYQHCCYLLPYFDRLN